MNAHYSALMDLPTTSNEALLLRQLCDGIETHLRSLAAMKQDVEQDILVLVITSRLSRKTLMQLELRKDQPSASRRVACLRKCLLLCVKSKEAPECLSSSEPVKAKGNGGALVGPGMHTVPHKSAEALVVLNDKWSNVGTVRALTLQTKAHGIQIWHPGKDS